MTFKARGQRKLPVDENGCRCGGLPTLRNEGEEFQRKTRTETEQILLCAVKINKDYVQTTAIKIKKTILEKYLQ